MPKLGCCVPLANQWSWIVDWKAGQLLQIPPALGGCVHGIKCNGKCPTSSSSCLPKHWLLQVGISVDIDGCLHPYLECPLFPKSAAQFSFSLRIWFSHCVQLSWCAATWENRHVKDIELQCSIKYFSASECRHFNGIQFGGRFSICQGRSSSRSRCMLISSGLEQSCWH